LLSSSANVDDEPTARALPSGGAEAGDLEAGPEGPQRQGVGEDVEHDDVARHERRRVGGRDPPEDAGEGEGGDRRHPRPRLDHVLRSRLTARGRYLTETLTVSETVRVAVDRQPMASVSVSRTAKSPQAG